MSRVVSRPRNELWGIVLRTLVSSNMAPDDLPSPSSLLISTPQPTPPGCDSLTRLPQQHQRRKCARKYPPARRLPPAKAPARLLPGSSKLQPRHRTAPYRVLLRNLLLSAASIPASCRALPPRLPSPSPCLWLRVVVRPTLQPPSHLELPPLPPRVCPGRRA